MPRPDAPSRLLTWAPLATGLLNTFGPVALNYGIALYFLSYAHGFVKRGLIGELFLPVAHVSTNGLRAIQIAFTLAAIALTYAVFRKLLFGNSHDRIFAGTLLAGPALLSHLAIMFEQPDVTLFLLLLLIAAAFLRLPPAAAALVSTALSCLALLAHEAFSLALYPFVVAMLWILCRQRRVAWFVAALNVILVAIAFLAILHFGTLKVAPEVILADAAHRTDVAVQRQVFDVMHSNLVQQRALVARFYRAWDFRFLLLLSALLTLPYALLLGGLLRRAATALQLQRLDRIVLAALFLTPLSLCFFGHDVGRWMSDCAIEATLFLLVLALREPPVRSALRDWASGSSPLLWLAWFFLTGPLDATALRAAEQLSILWTGR